MKIVNLTEDTKGCSGCEYEHGLSFYIETAKHKILADAGASDMILRNAERLGIDLGAVDTLVLSHGHYDHSGGIMPFAKINSHAAIYMRSTAVLDYYHGERYIGIDKEIAKLPGVVLTEDFLEIDNELSLFSGITGRRFRAKSNLALSKMENGVLKADSFDHEQCLVINTEGRKILVSGCAHNGILNVLDRYRQLYGGDPDAVISGFHMMKKTEYTSEDICAIENTANELAETDTLYFSGHCTGEGAFGIMKDIMGDKLRAIHSGDAIVLE